MKRIASICLILLLCVGVVFSAKTYVAGAGQLVYGTGQIITREQWIHNLVVTFDMSIEDGLVPDDYYTDMKSSAYYNDIKIAIYYGVIDLEAGEKFAPTDPVTREFAAHTLSFCMGYQADEDMAFTMSDVEDLIYPKDDQIALDNHWLSMKNGAFLPSAQISSLEAKNMLESTGKILKESEIDESHENEYEFADNVVEVPETSSFEFGEGNQIMLYDTSVNIKEGSVFAVYSNGIAYTYKAISLEEKEDYLLITTEDVMYEDAVESVDAQGVVNADLGQFVPEDGVDCQVEYETAAQSGKASKIGGNKNIGNLTLTKKLVLERLPVN